MTPCPLPLVALRGDETCPRCGRPAREHRGHPSYQETTMTETTEPTREQIDEIRADYQPGDVVYGLCTMALRTLDSETIACSCKPKRYRPRWVQFDTPTREQIEAWASDIEHADWREDATIDQQEHVLRMALRTLDAEAKLAAMTERAEKAERECAEAWDVHGMAVARAEKDEAQLAAMHRRAQRAESATADARREAIGQRKRADWWRSEAKRLGWTPDYPELRKDPPSDERLDCESSSLLLLSTWARRVMMRPKNRAKGMPSESIRTLLWMARDELFEAYSAIEEDAPTDDILAELGDAAAIIGFAMREVESRRAR